MNLLKSNKKEQSEFWGAMDSLNSQKLDLLIIDDYQYSCETIIKEYFKGFNEFFLENSKQYFFYGKARYEVSNRVTPFDTGSSLRDFSFYKNRKEIELERRLRYLHDKIDIWFSDFSLKKESSTIDLPYTLKSEFINLLDNPLEKFKDEYWEVVTNSYDLIVNDFLFKDIVKEFIELESIFKLVDSLRRQIVYILSKFKKELRNLRQVFTRYHSFHFKNLDDYHPTGFNLQFLG